MTYLGSKNIEEMFNKPGHGLEYADLVDTLETLLADGLIEAGVEPSDDRPGALDRAAIEAALTERGPADGLPYTYYQLSAEGGLRWELFAKPDWERYVVEDLDSDSGKGSLTGVDRKRLGEYLKKLSEIDFCVDPELVEETELRPWQATYWKCLPHAYSLHFAYREPKSGQPPIETLLSREHWNAQCAFWEWRDSWYRWH